MIPSARVARVFVCGDVIAILLQANGGGMMAQASMADIGQKIMLVGLFTQLLFLSVFLVISLVFWKRTRSSPKSHMISQYGKHTRTALPKILLVSTVIIILRCVFRIRTLVSGEAPGRLSVATPRLAEGS